MKGGGKYKWRGRERKRCPSEESGRDKNGNSGERMETEDKSSFSDGRGIEHKQRWLFLIYLNFSNALSIVSTSILGCGWTLC